MNRFINEQISDMHLVYEEVQGNSREAVRMLRYVSTGINYLIELCQTPGHLLQFTEGSVKLDFVGRAT